MKTPVYVFDLDGTLCFNIWRDPYDCTECARDLPITQTLQICRALARSEFGIIILTGRKQKWRTQTECWIKRYIGETSEIIMQEDSKTVKGDIFKAEMLSELMDQYEIRGVFDNDPEMEVICKALGIPLYLCK